MPAPSLDKKVVMQEAFKRRAEAINTTPGPTPEAVRAKDFIAVINSDPKGYKKAAKMARRPTFRQSDIDRLHDSIGTADVPRDKDGRKKHTGVEKQRATKLNDTIIELRGYSESDWVALDPDIKDALLEKVQLTLAKNPDLSAIFADPTEVEQFSQWLLGENTEFSAQLIAKFENLLKTARVQAGENLRELKTDLKSREIDKDAADKEHSTAEGRATSLQAEIDELQDETRGKGLQLKEARDNFNDNDREYNDANDEVTRLESRLQRLQRELTTSQNKGEMPARRPLATIDADIITTDANIARLNTIASRTPAEDAELANATAQLTRLKKEQFLSSKHGPSVGVRSETDIQDDINDIQTELRTAKKDRDEKKAKRDEKDRLETELRNKKTSKEAVDNDLTAKKKVKKLADIAYEAAKEAMDEQMRMHSSEERDLIDQFERVVEEQTIEWVNSELDRIDVQYSEYERELIVNETNENKKKLTEAVHRKLTVEKTIQVGPWWNKRAVTDRVTDPRQSERYNKILLADGPEGVMRAFLTDSGLTNDQANAVLADRDFVAANQEHVVTTVLARNIKANKITPGQVDVIERSTWGSGMITKAMEQNENIRKATEALLGEGFLQREGWHKRFWFEVRKNPLLLLMILTGSVVAGVAGVGIVGGIGATAALGGLGYDAFSAAQMDPSDEGMM